MAGRKPHPAYDDGTLKALWFSPVPLRTISGLLGVSMAAISRAAKKRGWPVRYVAREA